MGLNIDISLDKDIREIDEFFNDLRFKAVTLAARQGLNRAGERVRTFSNREIRKRRNLKLKDVKQRIKLRRARGMDITKLQAKVLFLGVPLPLILFLLGQKSPKAQRLPNPRRRSRRFEIVKGQKKAKPGLFVQKAERGKLRFQVFRRKDPSNREEGFAVQTAPSIAEILRSKSNILRKIENNAIALMQIEYDRALKFQLSKLKL